jgi:TetR/AcrR family transcriptional repressor of nem operon
MSSPTTITDRSGTKFKLVDAAVALMRQKGFTATTVDDICAEAHVTKGGFFHYFKSKDEIARAAAERFQEGKAKDFQEAPFRRLADPLDRVFGRLDFAKKASGGVKQVTKGCLLGMFAQELSFTNPEIRDTCRAAFVRVAKDFEKDLAEAKAAHPPRIAFEPKNVAMLYVAIIQGSLMLAKASESNAVLAENIEQLRGYLQSLFGLAQQRGGRQGERAGDISSN